MYFIPRNNKFYSFIAHMLPFYRYLLTFSVISLIFTLGLVGIYFPLDAYITRSMTRLSKLRTQYQQINKAQQACIQLKCSLQHLQDSKQYSQKERTTQTQTKSNLLLILEKAKNTGLALNHYSMDKEINDQWFRKKIGHFTFSGNLSKIINFLMDLKKVNRLLNYQDFSLQNIDNNGHKMKIILHFLSPNALKNPST